LTGISENIAPWAPWPLVVKELKHALWGMGKTKLLPMRSRRARGLILLTFGEANAPRRARGGGLKFLVFDGGARPRLSFSGFKKQLKSFTSIP
jgi:hypothetical protein